MVAQRRSQHMRLRKKSGNTSGRGVWGSPPRGFPPRLQARPRLGTQVRTGLEKTLPLQPRCVESGIGEMLSGPPDPSLGAGGVGTVWPGRGARVPRNTPRLKLVASAETILVRGQGHLGEGCTQPGVGRCPRPGDGPSGIRAGKRGFH